MSDPTFTWTNFEPGTHEDDPSFTSFQLPDLDLLTCNIPYGIGLAPDFVSDVLQDNFKLNQLSPTFELAAELTILHFMQHLTPPIYQQHRASIRRFLDLGHLQKEVNKRGYSLTPETKDMWIPRLQIIIQLNQGTYNSKERRAFHHYQDDLALFINPLTVIH